MSREVTVAKREPVVRMAKRDTISRGKAWGIRRSQCFSLVTAAVVIVAITKQNPVEVYLDRRRRSRNKPPRVGDHP